MKQIIVMFSLYIIVIFLIKQTVNCMTINFEFVSGSQYVIGQEPVNLWVPFTHKKPMIEPQETDITVKSGEAFTLTCKSPIAFIWVFNSMIRKVRGKKVINKIHISSINITKANTEDVGEYFCVQNIKYPEPIEYLQQLENRFKASRIYVFVDDPSQSLVDMEAEYTAYQYQIIVIPCKPTSKNITVQLIKVDGKFNFEIINYSAMHGFEVLVLEMSDIGTYKCIANNNKSITFKLDVIRLKNVISKYPKSYAYEGENFTIRCNYEEFYYFYRWTLPHNITLHRYNTTDDEENRISFKQRRRFSILTVYEANREKHEGNYTCTSICLDFTRYKQLFNETQWMSIINPNENYFIIKQSIGKFIFNAATKSAKVIWIIQYITNYDPELIWYDNYDREIEISTQYEKYNISKTEIYYIFQIYNVCVTDTGIYKMTPKNHVEQEIKLQLNVFSEPLIAMESYVFAKHDQVVELICTITGHPVSKLYWTFTPCTDMPNCIPDKTKKISGPIKRNRISQVIQQEIIEFKPWSPGKVSCSSKNQEGFSKKDALLFIKDFDDIIEVWTSSANNIIIIDDSLSIICAVLSYKLSGEIELYRNGESVINSSNKIITTTFIKNSYQKEIFFKNITAEDTGTYECRANFVIESLNARKSISVYVNGPLKPSINKSNLNGEKYELLLVEPIRFECVFVGYPIPVIEWFKDEDLLTLDNNTTRISIHSNNTILDITFVLEEDIGTYKCKGTNRLGSDFSIGILEIKGTAKTLILEIGVGTSFIVLVLILMFFIFLINRYKKLRRKAAGLHNFLTGCVDKINPDLPLEEQANLLPYSLKFEFPQDRLKLGQKLGEGNFGIVFKAIAYKIEPNKDKSVVAVKTIKGDADKEMRAFISELKIMIHVGKHLNVLNVLGAITKNIQNREMMIITEYCRFGNLQNFLLNRREVFVDQINPETDEIDETIISKEKRELKWFSDNNSNRQALNYADIFQEAFCTTEIKYDAILCETLNEHSKTVKTTPYSQQIKITGYLSHTQVDENKSKCVKEFTTLQSKNTTVYLSHAQVHVGTHDCSRKSAELPTENAITQSKIATGYLSHSKVHDESSRKPEELSTENAITQPKIATGYLSHSEVHVGPHDSYRKSEKLPTENKNTKSKIATGYLSHSQVHDGPHESSSKPEKLSTENGITQPKIVTGYLSHSQVHVGPYDSSRKSEKLPTENAITQPKIVTGYLSHSQVHVGSPDSSRKSEELPTENAIIQPKITSGYLSHLQLHSGCQATSKKFEESRSKSKNTSEYICHPQINNGTNDLKSAEFEKKILNNSQKNTTGYLSHSKTNLNSIATDNQKFSPISTTSYTKSKIDEVEPENVIKTSDLVNWGYQVACGMEYLSSRNVIHGDLAARNVLLYENNIVKICDFGLARSLYKDIYIKKSPTYLPFKWLAIESIQDKRFSQSSDVWSFGIFLWELFSLATDPYPGMNPDLDLFYKLLDGYRMHKPEYANEEIFDTILSCWELRPDARPLFSEIRSKLGFILKNDVKNKLTLLNEPFIQMNTQAFKEGQFDYMALIAKMKRNGSLPIIENENPVDSTPSIISTNNTATKNNIQNELSKILNNVNTEYKKSSINEEIEMVNLSKCR